MIATRSAFFAFWREVDEEIVTSIGESELRRRAIALVEEGAVPGSDLLDILIAYGAIGGA